MVKKLCIPIVLGTARKKRLSKNVSLFVQKEAKSYGFSSGVIDVADFLLERTIPPKEHSHDQRIQKWKKIVTEADGFIFVVPEYNHGYPGELKILLDSLYEEYKRKPVALCGVSDGPYGGARMIESLKLIFSTFGAVLTQKVLYVPFVNRVFDVKGTLLDEAYRKRLHALLEELSWYATIFSKERKMSRKKPL